MTALGDIQAAVYQKLTGDITLMSLVQGVFDDVDDNQAFPYIIIGEATENPFNTFGKDGKESTITIGIWSQYKGFKEALDILKQMNATLDDASLSLSEHNLVLIHYDSAQTIREQDGITRHVPVTYRVIIQEV
jgi:L-cystine uptake protein TcyP (sodium:dicarboxylate symporter family)